MCAEERCAWESAVLVHRTREGIGLRKVGHLFSPRRSASAIVSNEIDEDVSKV
jgi:hypothetical protein